MNQKNKRRLLAAVAVVVVGLVALNALACRQAYAMTHFTNHGVRTDKPENLNLGGKIKVLLCGVDLPRPQSKLPPSTLGPACRAVTISGTNAIKLGAWSCPASPARPLVILFHGYAGDKTGVVPEARVFQEMGDSVLLLDFRGSGESSESYTTIGYREAEDVAAAVDYAREHLSYSKLILYGESMGAAAVLRAVDRGGARPDAIIVEGVFDKMLNTVGHRFEAMGLPAFPGAPLLVFWGGLLEGFNGFAHNPVDYAASVRCPILFLHGEDDPRARPVDARRVFSAVPGPKRFHEFPGLGHEPAVVRFPNEWKETVDGFLKEADKGGLPR